MPGVTEGVVATPIVTSDWGAGYCSDVVVSTQSTTEKHWRVDLPKGITVSSLWNGVRTTQPDGTVSVGGAAWNHMVKAGSPTTFGYCATRTATAPMPTPTPTPTPVTGAVQVTVKAVSDWGTGRTVDVTVTNGRSTAASAWSVSFPWTGPVGAMWNATSSLANGRLKASNASWNGSLAAGASTTFGFSDATSTGMSTPTTCTAMLSGTTVPCTISITR